MLGNERASAGSGGVGRGCTHSKAVQQLSSATRQTESCPGVIGPISPEVKQMGARSAGNPHAACDVEGAGNVARSGRLGQLARQSSTLPGEAFLRSLIAPQVARQFFPLGAVCSRGLSIGVQEGPSLALGAGLS